MTFFRIACSYTGGRYEWTETCAPVHPPPGADEVYLALHGPVRLDWFSL